MDEMRAREVLSAAGFPGAAELLALGENAVFAADGLVVKVGRDATGHPELAARAEREVAVAEWLAASGVPAVRPAEPGVRLVEGHPVAVWHRLPAPVRPAEPRDLAPLLSRIHALSAPADFTLPRRELLGGVERWLTLAGDTIDPADADYLRARRDGFAAAAAALTPHLPPGPIHGDALPATSTSAPRARSWSTWRPSPRIYGNTTWSSSPSPATATACPPPPTTPSPPRTAGTSGSGRAARSSAAPARPRAAPGSPSTPRPTRRPSRSSAAGSPHSARATRRCGGIRSRASGRTRWSGCHHPVEGRDVQLDPVDALDDGDHLPL